MALRICLKIELLNIKVEARLELNSSVDPQMSLSKLVMNKSAFDCLEGIECERVWNELASITF